MLFAVLISGHNIIFFSEARLEAMMLSNHRDGRSMLFAVLISSYNIIFIFLKLGWRQ
jgi:hypothetical protein